MGGDMSSKGYIALLVLLVGLATALEFAGRSTQAPRDCHDVGHEVLGEVIAEGWTVLSMGHERNGAVIILLVKGADRSQMWVTAAPTPQSRAKSMGGRLRGSCVDVDGLPFQIWMFPEPASTATTSPEVAPQ